MPIVRGKKEIVHFGPSFNYTTVLSSMVVVYFLCVTSTRILRPDSEIAISGEIPRPGLLYPSRMIRSMRVAMEGGWRGGGIEELEIKGGVLRGNEVGVNA